MPNATPSCRLRASPDSDWQTKGGRWCSPAATFCVSRNPGVPLNRSMNYTLNPGSVRCDIFKPSGKRYDTIALDMSNYYDAVTANEAVRLALKDANHYQPEQWLIVVTNPYHHSDIPVLLGPVERLHQFQAPLATEYAVELRTGIPETITITACDDKGGAEALAESMSQHGAKARMVTRAVPAWK